MLTLPVGGNRGVPEKTAQNPRILADCCLFLLTQVPKCHESCIQQTFNTQSLKSACSDDEILSTWSKLYVYSSVTIIPLNSAHILTDQRKFKWIKKEEEIFAVLNQQRLIASRDTF